MMAVICACTVQPYDGVRIYKSGIPMHDLRFPAAWIWVQDGSNNTTAMAAVSLEIQTDPSASIAIAAKNCNDS